MDLLSPSLPHRAPRALLPVLCALALPALGDVFSPGELSNAHAQLEGIRNCTACHPRGGKLSPEKCLECHTELQSRIARGEGFHGRLSQAEREACQGCHREHQGRTFALVEWAPSRREFPHARTGWPLAGKHASLECAACHQGRRIADPAVKKLLAKNPKRETYLGLPAACASCHFDEHRTQLGEACEKCHTAAAWRPAPGFDHAKTDYELTGRHRQVKCDECHKPQQDTQTPADAFPAPRSRSFAAFGSMPHARCLDCHPDPHANRFGQNCESCHTTAGWRSVEGGKDNTFHAKTRFPLEGAHAQVKCKACHGPFPGQRAKFRGLKFAACTDCHADAHEGQLAKAPCSQCHTADDFTPARFEVEDHAKTKYPLEGAHRAAACSDCHKVDRSLRAKVPAALERALAKQGRKLQLSLVRFDLPADTRRCDSCHADPHKGQFAQPPAKDCSTCHGLTSFADLRFDHAKDAGFPLQGRHANTACASCHPAKAGVASWRGVPRGCAQCHADVHAGQFDGPRGPACERCHGADSFKSTHFVHAPPFTSYALEGKHQKVACEKCHPDVRLSAQLSVRRYRPLPRECEGCHEDFHQGAFSGFSP